MGKKVAVVCANGRVGQLVVKEAIERGLDVTAFVKGENKSAAREVYTLRRTRCSIKRPISPQYLFRLQRRR